jgi:MFS transporter, MFS domain-containing protein family, molybdate-anion transporter
VVPRLLRCLFLVVPTEGSFLVHGKAMPSLQTTYLVPVLCICACNWLQGPYFYDIYKSKYSAEDQDRGVRTVYAVGYCSSMVSSFFAGVLTDRFGRMRGCLVCCLLYFLSCLSVHCDQIEFIYIGRMLGGVASTLFHTAFEAWLNSAAAPEEVKLAVERQTFLGGVVAICAGGVATSAVKYMGPLAPFDVSALFSAVAFVCIFCLWNENYGMLQAQEGGANVASGMFSRGKCATYCQPSLVCLALAQVTFEGVMHAFIMVWSPAAKEAAGHSGHAAISPGLIFSMFMASIMAGTQVFSFLSSQLGFQPRYILVGVYAVGAACLSASSYFFDRQLVLIGCFAGFELCCGAYFPGIALCRSSLIPNSIRASVTSLYRVPQNFIVIMLIVYGGELGYKSRLQFCGLSLVLGAISVLMLARSSVDRKHKAD